MLDDQATRNRLLLCFERFKVSGYTQATVSTFLDEMRANGDSDEDIDKIKRLIDQLMGEFLSKRLDPNKDTAHVSNGKVAP